MSWDHQLDEQWADVPGAVGRVWVSTHGRVYRFDLGTRRTRPASISGGGADRYARVSMPSVDGDRGRSKGLHVILAEAFRGPRPPGNVARHLDDNRANLYLTNVAWGSRGDNVRDRYRNHPLNTTRTAAKISLSALVKRGWNRDAASAFLGRCDLQIPPTGRPAMRFYELDRVLAVEATDEFQAWMKRPRPGRRRSETTPNRKAS